MKKRIILATDPGTTNPAIRNAITAFLEGKGWSIWHWFDDLWLIDGVPTSVGLGPLRDELRPLLPPSVRLLILSAEGPMDHAGWVQQQSIPWITEHWLKK